MTTPVGDIKLNLGIDGTALPAEVLASIHAAMKPTILALQRDLSKLQRELAKTAREGESSAAKQAAANRGLEEAVERVGNEQAKNAVKAQAASLIQVRSIHAVTRAINEQTAALAANTAARAANAAAPTGGPPGSGGGFGGGSGGGPAGFASRGARGGPGFAGLIAGAAGLGVGAIPSFVTLTADLAQVIKQLSGATLLLPGAIAGTVTSVSTATIAFSGLGDALEAVQAASDGTEESLKAAEAALGALPPAAREVVTTFAGFKPLADEIENSVKQISFEGLAGQMQTLVDRQFPTVKRGFDDVASSWNSTFDELLRVGGSMDTTRLLDKVFGDTADAQRKANEAIDPLSRGLGILTAAGTDALPRLAGDIDSAATRFDKWMGDAASDGRLDDWINNGITGLEDLANTGLNLADVFSSIADAAPDNWLSGLEDITGGWADYLNSAEGQRALNDLIKQGSEQLDTLGDSLSNLGPAAGMIFDQATTSFGVLNETFNVVTGTLDFLLTKIPVVSDALEVMANPLKTAIDNFQGVEAKAQEMLAEALANEKTAQTPILAMPEGGLEGGPVAEIQLLGAEAYATQQKVDALGESVRTLPNGHVVLEENTPDVRNRIAAFGFELRQNPITGDVELVVRKEQAKVDIESFLAQYRNVTIGVNLKPNMPGQSSTAGVPNNPLNPGGIYTPPKRATGGPIIGPGGPTADLVPFMGSNGEWVLTADEVTALGGYAGVRSLTGRLRGYADGGPLGAVPGVGAVPGDPVVGLLTQIRDLLAGKMSGAIADTAQSVGTMADTVTAAPGTAGTGTQMGPFGTPLKPRGDPGYEMAAAAISALGGDPEKFLGADPSTYFAPGGAALAGGGVGMPDFGRYAAGLAAFAQSGSVSDVLGLGLDANDPVVKAIASARNKKKGALGSDAISGLISQVFGGGYTGVLDSSNTSLVTALQTYREKLAKGAGIPTAATMPMYAPAAAVGDKTGLQPAASALFDVIAARFPEVTKIGGVRDDPLPDHPSGRALDIMVGQNQELGDRINEFLRANAAGLGLDSTIWRDQWADFQGNMSTVGGHQDHIHALTAAGAAGYAGGGLYPPGLATAPGLPGADLATSGAPMPVYVVNLPGAGFPGAPGLPGMPGVGPAGAAGGPAGFPGASIMQAGFSAAGGVGADVSSSLLSAVLQGTNFDVPDAPAASNEQLIKERNPLALASMLGFDVPDYTRQGGGGGEYMRNEGPQFDSKGRMFSDSGALIDRTMTDLGAQLKAQFDQTLAVFDEVKNRLGEDALQPVMQAAVTSGIEELSNRITQEIGRQMGQTAGPEIANAVAKAVSSVAAQSGGSGTGVGGLVSSVGAEGQKFLFRAEGGPITGPGTSTSDSILARLSTGEYVVNARDVARAGGFGGMEAWRRSLPGFATGGGVIGNATVGAEFFGVSQVPIIGAIVNLLVRVLLKMIGVEIEVRDTLDELSSEVRQFRGDFQAFDATGRLMNDNSGLLDRSQSSEQAVADERIRILKIVLEALVKFIIEKILIPIGKAVANAAIQAGASAAGAAVNTQAPGAGGIVSSLISSAGQAGVDIGADLIGEFWAAATPVIIDSVGEGLQTFFPDIMTEIFGGGLLANLFDPTAGFLGIFTDMLGGGLMNGLLGNLTGGFGGGLAGILSALLGGLSFDFFDQGGVANGTGFMAKAIIDPERTLSPRETSAFEQMVARDFESNSSRTVQMGGVTIHTGASATDVADELNRIFTNALD